MANEDPAFGGMGNADAISAAASAISGIRSDMAAIERHAKGVAREMRKVSSAEVAKGGGSPRATESTTGSATPAFEGSSLGQITQALGGPVAAAGFALGGVGAAAGVALGSSPLAGSIALGGFRDLRVGIPRALGYERAQFAFRMGQGGQYSQFGNFIDQAANQFNVQNEQTFAAQSGQLAQFFGLTNPQIYGGISGLTTMAGMSQEAAGGVYGTLYGNQAYYASMAAGVQTRSVTGEMLSPESVVNQLYQRVGFGNMNKAEARRQLQMGVEPGGMLRTQLEQMFGGDQNTINAVIMGLQSRIDAGAPLRENALGEQLTEAGVLGGRETQGFESELRLERERLTQTGTFYDEVTEGFSGAVDQITEAIHLLNTDFRDLAEAAERVLAGFDVFANELPKTTASVNSAISGLGSLLSTAGASLLGGAMGARGVSGVRGAAGMAGRGAMAAGRLGLRAIPGVGAAVAGVGATEWAQGAADNGSWDAKDWLGTTAAYAGTGALVGSVIPGLGTAVGAIAGTIIGGVAGLISSNQEQQRYEASKASEPSSGLVRPRGVSVWEWDRMSQSEKREAAGMSEGRWFVQQDQIAKVHYGEMVVPARIANAVRQELDLGQVSPSTRSSRGDVNVNINVAIQRGTDHEAMLFASKVKRIIETDAELLSAGAGRF